MNRFINILLLPVAALLLVISTSCDDDTSYTELLNTESQNVNRFLSDHRVVGEIPADTVFEVGADAPYYQIDTEGKLFMQVLELGNGDMTQDGQIVYFRYNRYNLTNYVSGEELTIYDTNDNAGWEPTYFRFGDTLLPSSTEWGTGIQQPLRFVPLNSRVNLIVKAEYGKSDESSYVQPMLFDIRYYPSRL